ncbi:hypothetical protein PROFUN_16503 [Planoprotostelium fungivorum]|uniref:Uncharacterized protein n=1 Tax=Planoprotostelium fungivorum TaxID=1890364 RepID=A0A2P6MQ36_9EUKA|nr:hypothetical protein PROFUN_16503 [Planoprotostelium fungivorum]
MWAIIPTTYLADRISCTECEGLFMSCILSSSLTCSTRCLCQTHFTRRYKYLDQRKKRREQDEQLRGIRSTKRNKHKDMRGAEEPQRTDKETLEQDRSKEAGDTLFHKKIPPDPLLSNERKDENLYSHPDKDDTSEPPEDVEVVKDLPLFDQHFDQMGWVILSWHHERNHKRHPIQWSYKTQLPPWAKTKTETSSRVSHLLSPPPWLSERDTACCWTSSIWLQQRFEPYITQTHRTYPIIRIDRELHLDVITDFISESHQLEGPWISSKEWERTTSVVQNTPKALKHLLVNLMRITDCLDLDKRQVIYSPSPRLTSTGPVRRWVISYRSHVQSHLPRTHHHVQPQGTYVIVILSGFALNQHLAAVQPSSVPLQHQVTRPTPSPRRLRRPNGYQTSHTAAKLIGSYCKRTKVEFEPELPTLMSHLMDNSSLAQQLALTSLERDFEKATRKDNVAKYIPELKMQLHQGHSGPNKGPTNSKPLRSEEKKGTEEEKRGISAKHMTNPITPPPRIRSNEYGWTNFVVDRQTVMIRFCLMLFIVPSMSEQDNNFYEITHGRLSCTHLLLVLSLTTSDDAGYVELGIFVTVDVSTAYLFATYLSKIPETCFRGVAGGRFHKDHINVAHLIDELNQVFLELEVLRYDLE